MACSGVLIVIGEDEQLGIGMKQMALDTFDAASGVYKDGDSAGQDSSPEGDVPVSAVFAEDGDFVLGQYISSLDEVRGEAACLALQSAEGEVFFASCSEDLEVVFFGEFGAGQGPVKKLNERSVFKLGLHFFAFKTSKLN